MSRIDKVPVLMELTYSPVEKTVQKQSQINIVTNQEKHWVLSFKNYFGGKFNRFLS